MHTCEHWGDLTWAREGLGTAHARTATTLEGTARLALNDYSHPTPQSANLGDVCSSLHSLLCPGTDPTQRRILPCFLGHNRSGRGQGEALGVAVIDLTARTFVGASWGPLRIPMLMLQLPTCLYLQMGSLGGSGGYRAGR